jgi:leader peptidase (prepilin peptidase)/N-methyltransferase
VSVALSLVCGSLAGPVVSALVRRSTGRDPGVRSWLLVAATAICAVAGVVSAAPGFHVLAFLWFAVAGVALTVIDVQTLRLPNGIIVPSWVLVGALLAAESARCGQPGRAVTALLASVASAAALFLPALVLPASLGMGDVKLAGLVALLLGWSGWGAVVSGLVAGFVLAAGTGLLLVLTGRIGAQQPIPLGPFLIGGTWLGVGVG